MKQFIFSHILFATCLVIFLSLTTPVSAQDCYGDYVDSVATVTIEFYYPSKFPGAPFTIDASGKQIVFAGGNLQYNAAQNKWRFAEHQYDVIGDDLRGGNATGTKDQGVIITGTKEDRATQDKWIDLFQWGTSGYRNTYYEDKHNAQNYGASAEKKYVYQPWDFEDRGNTRGLNSKLLNLYKGSLIDSSFINKTELACESDWAWHNAITNGGCEVLESGQVCYTTAHKWYTPSAEELNYIAFKRSNASKLIGFATLKISGSDKHGIILLPDAWSWDAPGLEGWGAKWKPRWGCNVQATSAYEFKWNDNVLTEAEWDTFEDYGAVFLPATGAMQFGDWHWYDGHGIVNEYGEYWTGTCNAAGNGSNTIRFYTITGVDHGSDGADRYGALFMGGGTRSHLFSCAIRPVRVFTK
ncbi:MAG: hypothetical protein IKO63_05825 [Paludibacteraceae bacterium]|nr:hypothetical protein [Paludibacteraceae bacterium]